MYIMDGYNLFLINADDFGMTKGINEAVYELLKIGAINSCSLMCNMPYTYDAIEKVRLLINNGVKFNLNLHFNITQGNSIFNNLQFNKSNLYTNNINFVYNELISQLTFIKQNDIIIHGIDCHHNINLKNNLVNDIIKNNCNIRIRNNQVYTKIFNNVDELVLASGCIDKKVNEIMVHPSLFVDNLLRQCSIYTNQRVSEYKMLKNNVAFLKTVILNRNKNIK